MPHAAKRKTQFTASLAAVRLLLLLVVACCGLETRVWSFAATPPTASGEIAFATPSFIGENHVGVAYDASDSLVAAKSGATLADDLAAAATRARNTVGPGSGGAYGTRVHSAFAGEVNALNQGLSTEISYLNGVRVNYGTPGSVRLDVVNGPLNAPVSIFDLKTGSATLTPARIQQIQSHIPGGANVPVFQVRP